MRKYVVFPFEAHDTKTRIPGTGLVVQFGGGSKGEVLVLRDGMLQLSSNGDWYVGTEERAVSEHRGVIVDAIEQ